MCKLCYERIELPHIKLAKQNLNQHELLLETNPPMTEELLDEHEQVKMNLQT